MIASGNQSIIHVNKCEAKDSAYKQTHCIANSSMTHDAFARYDFTLFAKTPVGISLEDATDGILT